jgi:ankyrin repeat protein
MQKDNSQLFDYSINGDASLLCDVVSRGVDLNVQDDCGICAIHHAALNGNFEVFKILVSAGVSMESKDASGRQPIHCAAFGLGNRDGGGHMKIMDFLLSRGADINKLTEKADCTPIHCAAYAGFEDMFIYLTMKGASLKIKTSDGKTPLTLIAERGLITVSPQS